MRINKIFWLFLFACVLQTPSLLAQTFPVQVTTAIRPPYSLQLADFANPNYDRIQANVYMADLTQVNYRALVRLVIKGPGGIEISTSPGSEFGPIFLNGGTTEILTGAELNDLFKLENLNFIGISKKEYLRRAALPEGVYQFHFEIRDFNNPNIAVSSTMTGFTTAWLILNDPPIINQPANKATVEPQPVQNIFFQWTPRHTGSPNAAFTTEYQIQIAEIYPSDRNANDAMQTSPPIFETTTLATAFNYGITEPDLIEGRWYAFRVRAYDTDGRDFFKNQGYSEVYKFYYGKKCPVPEIRVEQLSPQSLQLTWQAESKHNFYKIKYRPKGKEVEVVKKRFLSRKKRIITKTIQHPWVYEKASGNNLIIDDADLHYSYEFQVLGYCQHNESDWSPLALFTSDQLMVSGGCAAPMEDGFAATLTNQGTEMTWDSWPQFTAYSLNYRKAGEEQWKKITTVGTEITEEPLDPEAVYEYQLIYQCKSGEIVEGMPGTFSIEVSPDYVPPVIPTTGWCFSPSNVVQQVINDSTVVIEWEEEEKVEAYEVSYKKGDGSQAWVYSGWINATRATIDSLEKNTDYVYRVRSMCTDGLPSEFDEEYAFDTDNVYSHTGPCEPPTAQESKAISGNMARVNWSPESYHSGFVVEIKKPNSDTWHEYEVSDSVKTLTGLEPSIRYEYRLQGLCGIKNSDYTTIDTFTTLQADQIAEGEFVCGVSSDINIEDQVPVEALEIGDKIKAADFEMEVSSLESGVPYNGKAQVKFPYFNNARITLQMVNAKINENYELYDGYLYMLSADVILYELPPSGRLANALVELNKISGDYLNNLDAMDGILSEVLGALEGFPDVKQAIGQAINAIKDKLSKAKEAKNNGEKEKGENLASQVKDMMKDLINDAVEALLNAPDALASALDNFQQWVKEILEELKAKKGQSKEELDAEKTSLLAQLATFFEDLFDDVDVDPDDVKRVYTKTIEQEFTDEEYRRFKQDPNWADWNALVARVSQVELDYDKAVKFYNYAEVFLIPNNIGKLAGKLKEDLGETLMTLGKEVMNGGNVEEKAKELIKELLISNIEELVEETPTTDVTGEVDAFLRQLEVSN